MAAIDKIYGTKDQYNEFHAWCAEHKTEALMYFYSTHYDGGPITNLPIRIDDWLLENCPIKWVTDAIKYQHGIAVS